jgi:hypothetical protein
MGNGSGSHESHVLGASSLSPGSRKEGSPGVPDHYGLVVVFCCEGKTVISLSHTSTPLLSTLLDVSRRHKVTAAVLILGL